MVPDWCRNLALLIEVESANFNQESSLRLAHVAQEPRLDDSGYRDPDAWDRRYHSHLPRLYMPYCWLPCLPSPEQLVMVWSKVNGHNNGMSAGDFSTGRSRVSLSSN